MDFPTSEEERRTVVRQSVDPDLDNLKQTYNGMESLLKQAAVSIASKVSGDLNGCELNVIYYPQLGFNIAIPLDESGQAIYDGRSESWNRVFTTESCAYFKDRHMVEMDEKLGDIYVQIGGKGSTSRPFVLF